MLDSIFNIPQTADNMYIPHAKDLLDGVPSSGSVGVIPSYLPNFRLVHKRCFGFFCSRLHCCYPATFRSADLLRAMAASY